MEYMFYDNIKQKDPWVRHRRKIPSLGIGKQQEKIQVWWEISPQLEKKCLPMHELFSTGAPIVYEVIYVPLFYHWRNENCVNFLKYL
jgi:hypothetical protein